VILTTNNYAGRLGQHPEILPLNEHPAPMPLDQQRHRLKRSSDETVRQDSNEILHHSIRKKIGSLDKIGLRTLNYH